MSNKPEKSSKMKTYRSAVEEIRKMVKKSPGILDEDVEDVLSDQGYNLDQICAAFSHLRGISLGNGRRNNNPEIITQIDRSAELKRRVGRRLYLTRDLPPDVEIVEETRSAALAEGADSLILDTLNLRSSSRFLRFNARRMHPLMKVDYELLQKSLKLIKESTKK